jgi:hypothetical protein
VTQEVVSQSAPLGGALDQAGNVRHDELGGVIGSTGALADSNDAEIGHQRGEGIVGDLRSRRRDPCDQCRLTDIGKSDQRDVGLQLQLEVEPVLLSALTLLGEGRRPAAVGKEAVVALAPESALGGEPAVARTVEVDKKFALTAVDHGADGHDDDLILAPRPVLALRGAVLAVGRPAKGVVLKAQQGGLIVVRDDPHVPTLAAVTAVGSALGDVGFTAKTDAAGPAVARFGVQLGEIDEGGHHHILRPGISNPLGIHPSRSGLRCREPG